MSKMKVRIVSDSKKILEALPDVDIVILAHLRILHNGEGVELWSSKLFTISPETVRILSRVECVRKAEPLHGSNGITLLSTEEVIGTNTILRSLRDVFGDLEISV